MDLAKLKELAQAATPGPWGLNGPRIVVDRAFATIAQINGYEEQDAIDAIYIAAAHPQTVLELIAEVERLREASYRLREEIRWLRKGAE